MSTIAVKTKTKPKSPKLDAVLSGAVEIARAAVVEACGEPTVGEHLGYRTDADRLGSHVFATTNQGYRGWQWTVTVARAPRSRTATVCEIELLPGDGALLPPTWLPWADRLAPGDLGPTDVLPFIADDPRLETGHRPTGDVAVDHVAVVELGLGRERVPTRLAIDAAAQRWNDSDRGASSPGARASDEPCESCGFMLPLQGSLGSMFGVCLNEWSPDDGKVVAADHACGAHSETDAPEAPAVWNPARPVVDEFDLEVTRVVSRADAPPQRETALDGPDADIDTPSLDGVAHEPEPESAPEVVPQPVPVPGAEPTPELDAEPAPDAEPASDPEPDSAEAAPAE